MEKTQASEIMSEIQSDFNTLCSVICYNNPNAVAQNLERAGYPNATMNHQPDDLCIYIDDLYYVKGMQDEALKCLDVPVIPENLPGQLKDIFETVTKN